MPLRYLPPAPFAAEDLQDRGLRMARAAELAEQDSGMAPGRLLGVVLRNFDGQNGRTLAGDVQGAFGTNVLSGRGTKK